MWCVAELNKEYIARMEDVLNIYEKPLSEREPVVCVVHKSCHPERLDPEHSEGEGSRSTRV